jgi:thiol-disulfide isomerase/thioredoxin
MSDDPRTRDHTSSTAPVSAASGRPGLLRSLAHHLAGDPDVLPVEGQLPPFDGATGWLNSEPLTPEGLRGRVVLVDFWTYTCINWLRTAPYVKAWDAKYRDLGLAVIGVHTPEFGFEHDLNNVTARSREFGGEYPIAVDSDYRVWQAFDNHFWPALYVADPDGRIRYHHFGEGEYAMAEMVVQQLLLEAGVDGVNPASCRWNRGASRSRQTGRPCGRPRHTLPSTGAQASRRQSAPGSTRPIAILIPNRRGSRSMNGHRWGRGRWRNTPP